MDHKQNHQNPAADRIDTCIIGDMAQQEKLAPMAEVITLLKNGGHSFTDLAPIRERYEAQFGSDQTWSFPFHDGSHLGGVFLPVKEGILYLPYDCVCSDCYEQFKVGDAHLLDGAEARRLLDILETHYSSLHRALQKAAGLEAVDESPDESSAPMARLESVLEQKTRYIRMQTYPVTERLPITDISRELIQAMADVHGVVYLGKHDSDDLVPYTGQPIYNFQYNFCVPVDSEPLKALLRTGLPDYKVFDAFYQLLRSLDGHWLFWA